MSIEELKTKSMNELKELVKDLPKEVMEFVNSLIGMINPKKKREVTKTKEVKEVVDDEPKKKGKGKGGKKGKNVEEKEEEKEEIVETYLDVFVKVTDFGGPLFKPYDRTFDVL